jgi:hypothetical protein
MAEERGLGDSEKKKRCPFDYMWHDSLNTKLISATHLNPMALNHSHHSHIRIPFSYDISSIYIYIYISLHPISIINRKEKKHFENLLNN